MHVSACHFMVHAYTPSVTANHHMLGIQIPSYTRAGHIRQNNDGLRKKKKWQNETLKLN